MKLPQRIRRRVRAGDEGSQFIEISIATAISMVAFALVGTVLSSAQRQERISGATGLSVDTARMAMAQVVKEVREARSISMAGPDARAWFDINSDGIRDADEIFTYGLRPDGEDQKLVRIRSTGTDILGQGLESGTFAVTLSPNGQNLTISVTVPGPDPARAATTLSSQVSLRGNF